MTEDTLEILIGKYIDGEITPSEQNMLDGAMKKDAGVRELVEQLAELHQASAEAVASEILERGKSAEEIFEQAWACRRNPILRAILRSDYVRFAAGVAAGLLIGLALHFALSGDVGGGPNKNGAGLVADNTSNGINVETAAPSLAGQEVIRNVDYYGFTDKDGDQWLVEGLRENRVRPAVYYDDL